MPDEQPELKPIKFSELRKPPKPPKPPKPMGGRSYNLQGSRRNNFSVTAKDASILVKALEDYRRYGQHNAEDVSPDYIAEWTAAFTHSEVLLSRIKQLIKDQHWE